MDVKIYRPFFLLLEQIQNVPCINRLEDALAQTDLERVLDLMSLKSRQDTSQFAAAFLQQHLTPCHRHILILCGVKADNRVTAVGRG